MSSIEKLIKQIDFIAEVDKLKGVLRKTYPIGMSRRENSAEHSWQVVLSAITFQEHANEPVDLLKVVKMLALHDIVEVDVGDTFHYDKAQTQDLFEREFAAAKRILNILDAEQRDEYLGLWREFEDRKTPEAKYAAAVDRIMAFIVNSRNKGGNWPENNITVKKALEKNAHMEEGSKALWEVAQRILEECCAKGYISQE
jgi:putative hydrolase of HD superfamily